MGISPRHTSAFLRASFRRYLFGRSIFREDGDGAARRILIDKAILFRQF